MQNPFFHEIGDIVQFGSPQGSERVLSRAAGGFGAVYILQDLAGKGPVTAVKTLRADAIHTDEFITRFSSEAEIWLNLPYHINVLPALEVRQYNRLPYIRMPFIPPHPTLGTSLLQHIKNLRENNAAFDEGAFIYLGCQLIRALDFLERESPGFVHGDIKPANVLIHYNEENLPFPKLSDFGLAKAHSSNRDSIPMAGDVSYLAPECYDGQTPWSLSDIYATGATLFELALNTPPQIFDRHSGTFKLAFGGDILGGLNELRPDLSEFNTLIARCLNPNPQLRPQSFSEVNEIMLHIAKSRGALGHQTKKPVSEIPDWLSVVDASPLFKYVLNKYKCDESTASNALMKVSDAANLRGAGRLLEADAVIDEVLKDLPEFGNALQGKAHGLMLSKQYSEAAELYLRAIAVYERDPDLMGCDVDVYAGACVTAAQLLLVYEPLGDQDQSLGFTLARKGMQLIPENAKAQMTMGIAHGCVGDYQEACKYLEVASQLDPSNRAIKLNLLSFRKMLSEAQSDE